MLPNLPNPRFLPLHTLLMHEDHDRQRMLLSAAKLCAEESVYLAITSLLRLAPPTSRPTDQPTSRLAD
jgi:hypothetical protein